MEFNLEFGIQFAAHPNVLFFFSDFRMPTTDSFRVMEEGWPASGPLGTNGLGACMGGSG
jgi:hypothetical protein